MGTKGTLWLIANRNAPALKRSKTTDSSGHASFWKNTNTRALFDAVLSTYKNGFSAFWTAAID